jgi:hypothetical protein
MSITAAPERDEYGNFTQIVKIQEESRDPAKQTGSNYQAMSHSLVVDHSTGTWKNLDITYPYPIALFSAEWVNEALYEGDIFKVLIAPNTTVGAITSDVAASATVLNVQSTVTDNVKPGYVITITDGTNTDELGRCTEVDPDAGTITVETPTTNAFAAATPTYIQMTIEMVRCIKLSGKGRYELGKDVIGGSFIPAGAKIRVSYQNNEGTTTGKEFTVILEYKY